MKFYFTFGHGQRHEINDIVLDKNTCLVVEDESEGRARKRVSDLIGLSWCTTYLTPEDAGVEKWNYRLVDFDELLAQDGPGPVRFFIWSIEHEGWWLPTKHGYTQDIEKAGRFSLGEAEDIVSEANFVRTEEIAIPDICIGKGWKS